MKNSSGLTLVELMVTMGIFAMLTSIATPNVISWMDNARLGSASRQVMSAIQDARMHAVKENSRAELDFTNPGNSYLTRKWNRGTNNWNIQTHDLPPGVQMNTNIGGGQLFYNSRGLPRNPATPWEPTSGIVTLTNGQGTTINVEVTSMGNVRID